MFVTNSLAKDSVINLADLIGDIAAGRVDAQGTMAFEQMCEQPLPVRLRHHENDPDVGGSIGADMLEAADTIEDQAARIADLEAALAKALAGATTDQSVGAV
jgi:hypothetical protein